MTKNEKVIGGIGAIALILALVGLVGSNQSVSQAPSEIAKIAAQTAGEVAVNVLRGTGLELASPGTLGGVGQNRYPNSGISAVYLTSTAGTTTLKNLVTHIDEISCADATTTLVANIRSPFFVGTNRATSTIERAILKQTGAATGTVYAFLATTTSANLGHAPATARATTSSLFNGAPILGDDLAYIVSGTPSWAPYPPNATSTNANPSIQRQVVRPDDILALWIESYGNTAAGGGTGSWTNEANTAVCSLQLEWKQY